MPHVVSKKHGLQDPDNLPCVSYCWGVILTISTSVTGLKTLTDFMRSRYLHYMRPHFVSHWSNFLLSFKCSPEIVHTTSEVHMCSVWCFRALVSVAQQHNLYTMIFNFTREAQVTLMCSLSCFRGDVLIMRGSRSCGPWLFKIPWKKKSFLQRAFVAFEWCVPEMCGGVRCVSAQVLQSLHASK